MLGDRFSLPCLLMIGQQAYWNGIEEDLLHIFGQWPSFRSHIALFLKSETYVNACLEATRVIRTQNV